MENERKLLLRSASAAELSTPKKNRCSYNNNPILICDGMSDTKYNDPSENIQNQSMVCIKVFELVMAIDCNCYN